MMSFLSRTLGSTPLRGRMSTKMRSTYGALRRSFSTSACVVHHVHVLAREQRISVRRTHARTHLGEEARGARDEELLAGVDLLHCGGSDSGGDMCVRDGASARVSGGGDLLAHLLAQAFGSLSCRGSHARVSYVRGRSNTDPVNAACETCRRYVQTTSGFSEYSEIKLFCRADERLNNPEMHTWKSGHDRSPSSFERHPGQDPGERAPSP